MDDFRAAYAAAFRDYVGDASEMRLRTAYELGREAVVQELTVLDLTLVHHDALLAMLREAPTAEVEHVTRAAAAFVLESVSAFEMVRRGFNEAQETARLERQHAAMLRQLSSFLADASLALAAPDSLEEMLQLVAEQARELLGCDWCRVSVGGALGEVREVTSASKIDGAAPPPYVGDDSTAMPGIATAFSPDQVQRRDSLATPLAALDGRIIGSVELALKRDGGFNEVDRAILANLAQMVSATIERARAYPRHT